MTFHLRRRHVVGVVALVAAAGTAKGACRLARVTYSRIEPGPAAHPPTGRHGKQNSPGPAPDASPAQTAPTRRGGWQPRTLANALAAAAIVLAVPGVVLLRGGAGGVPSVAAEQPRWVFPPALGPAVDAQAPAVTSTDAPAPHPFVAIPAHIRIDAIGVASAVVPVGLASDGTLGLPPMGTAGWYELGVRPGERGYSVVAAHVDNHRGPDVFHQLRKLKTGDRVVIVDVDGGSRTFEVQHVEQQPKEILPTSAIWQPVDRPMLALITCGGAFDRTTRSYRDNVVVHTALLQ